MERLESTTSLLPFGPIWSTPPCSRTVRVLTLPWEFLRLKLCLAGACDCLVITPCYQHYPPGPHLSIRSLFSTGYASLRISSRLFGPAHLYGMFLRTRSCLLLVIMFGCTTSSMTLDSLWSLSLVGRGHLSLKTCWTTMSTTSELIRRFLASGLPRWPFPLMGHVCVWLRLRSCPWWLRKWVRGLCATIWMWFLLLCLFKSSACSFFFLTIVDFSGRVCWGFSPL